MQDRSLSNIGPNFIFTEKWVGVVYSLISPQRRYELVSILTSGTLNELGTAMHQNFSIISIYVLILCTKKSTGVVNGLDAIIIGVIHGDSK